jgi:hypothetical protein
MFQQISLPQAGYLYRRLDIPTASWISTSQARYPHRRLDIEEWSRKDSSGEGKSVPAGRQRSSKMIATKQGGTREAERAATKQGKSGNKVIGQAKRQQLGKAAATKQSCSNQARR